MKREKPNLLYFRYLRNIVVPVLLICLSVQCQYPGSKKSTEISKELPTSENLDFSKFRMILKDSFNVKSTKYHHILYFTNNGCVGCNDRYFSILNKNRFKKNVLIVFSGDESDFDFNQIDTGKANQIIDKKKVFKDLTYLRHPSIIQVKTGEIDTIYTVDASFKQFDSIIHTLLKDSSVLHE